MPVEVVREDVKVTISQSGVRGLVGPTYTAPYYFVTPKIINENVIIPGGQNAIMVGDIEIANGYTLEVGNETDLRIL